MLYKFGLEYVDNTKPLELLKIQTDELRWACHQLILDSASETETYRVKMGLLIDLMKIEKYLCYDPYVDWPEDEIEQEE